MTGYRRPTDAPVSDTWQGHKNRTPPSAEPGTDYACAYGTDLELAEAGTVSVIDTSPGGGEGRRMSIDLDDGRRVSYIHLSAIFAYIGQRVARGQRGVIYSGASGNGSDWYYGPHVHVSLWERPGMPYAQTIDFDARVGEPPPPIPPPPPPPGADNMFLIKKASLPEQIVLITADGGQLRARYLEDPYERAVFIATAPPLPITVCDDPTFDGFLSRVGYVYGAPIPLLPVEATVVTNPPPPPPPTSTHDHHDLVVPAWVGSGILSIIGLVEVLRFIIEHLTVTS